MGRKLIGAVGAALGIVALAAPAAFGGGPSTVDRFPCGNTAAFDGASQGFTVANGHINPNGDKLRCR